MSKFFKDKKELIEFNNRGFEIKNNYFDFKNKKFNCLHIACNERAINSHTISKKSSLQYISENNQLLCYSGKRDQAGNITPMIKKVGLNSATTFKGFCTEHEKLFECIDLNGIKTKKDLMLQIYRQIAYSYYNCGALEVMINACDDRIANYLKEIYQQLSEQEIKNVIDEYKNEKFKRNKILREMLNKFAKIVENLCGNLDNLSSNEIFELEEVDMIVFFKRIDINIPVAIINDLEFIARNKIGNWFFSVIPYENATDIIMFVDKELKSWAKSLWNHYTKDKIHILNFVELAMMKSEFWFIKPSIINNMSDEKRKFLEEDIRYTNERQAFCDYDVSIFDELRKNLVEDMKIDIKERELSKINNIPVREPYVIREEKLQKYINGYLSFKKK